MFGSTTAAPKRKKKRKNKKRKGVSSSLSLDSVSVVVSAEPTKQDIADSDDFAAEMKCLCEEQRLVETVIRMNERRHRARVKHRRLKGVSKKNQLAIDAWHRWHECTVRPSAVCTDDSLHSHVCDCVSALFESIDSCANAVTDEYTHTGGHEAALAYMCLAIVARMKAIHNCWLTRYRIDFKANRSAVAIGRVTVNPNDSEAKSKSKSEDCEMHSTADTEQSSMSSAVETELPPRLFLRKSDLVKWKAARRRRLKGKDTRVSEHLSEDVSMDECTDTRKSKGSGKRAFSAMTAEVMGANDSSTSSSKPSKKRPKTKSSSSKREGKVKSGDNADDIDSIFAEFGF